MTYYEILGIEPNAKEDEIKKAFKNHIAAYHPDYYRGPNIEFAEEQTKKLNEA